MPALALLPSFLALSGAGAFGSAASALCDCVILPCSGTRTTEAEALLAGPSGASSADRRTRVQPAPKLLGCSTGAQPVWSLTQGCSQTLSVLAHGRFAAVLRER